MLTGNDFGTLHAPSCYQCHEDLWNRNGNAPPVMVAIGPLTGKAGQAVTFDASAIRDPEGDPVAYEWSFGDGSPAQLPSHNPKTAHTYGEIGTYTATLAVTDGVNAPQHVQITVTIGAAAPTPVADRWNVTTTEPSSFTITFETHSGSLVGIRDGRVLSLGIEYSGVIFWMELWMDASGNAYWGTGDMYFGNINRRRGTMSGVVFDEAGAVLTFSGIKN
jgi:hypothetical protein